MNINFYLILTILSPEIFKIYLTLIPREFSS